VDVEAYLERIGYSGDRDPSYAVLKALHRAHLQAIPFENLDIQLGRPILLDLESLEAKLVRGRRGGYCFEQNALFAAVLDRLGFTVTRLGARVRLGSAEVRARTHMLLAVELDGVQWLADVGFGAAGILEPVLAEPGVSVDQNGWQHRVVEEKPGFVLQSFYEGKWRDLYAFTLEEQYPADYELGNYFTSTHPESRFVTQLTAQRIMADVRFALTSTDLTEIRPGATITTPVESDDALLEILAEWFGLAFPVGTRFRAP
jgi:N-hydroxyarylamine O-acetyltransferase